MKPLSFFVRGRAATAGSKRGFALKKNGVYTGRVAMIGMNKEEKNWKATIAAWATHAMKQAGITELMMGPVRLEVTFVMQRPKYHLNSKGLVKPQFQSDRHISTPDEDKLLRCLKDALTQVVWRDDSQVCTALVLKRYGPIPGAQVTISEDAEESPISLPKIPENIPQQETLSLT